MTDPTLAPAIPDSHYVEVDGHRLLRVMGGDGTEVVTPDKPAEEPVVPEAPEPGQAETTDVFDEKFDPSTLPEELRAGWNQLRADYTRKTQTVAEQRKEAEQAIEFVAALQNPETRAQALQAIGLEVADEELDLSALLAEEDPTAARLDALEQAYRQANDAQQNEQVQQALESHIDVGLQALEERTGRQFSDDELNALEALAMTQADEYGLPSVDKAFSVLYEQVLPQERQRWVDSKKAPQIPLGTSGEPKIDLIKDTDARVNYMAQIAEAHMQ